MEPSRTLAVGPVRYARHQPETTLLYQLVERHYPDFLAALAERDRHLERDQYQPPRLNQKKGHLR